MKKHSSSVNFQNLIRDLAEMYTFEVTEVIVVELIANSLDAKASHILIDYDPSKKVLVVQDDGEGMNALQFEEYHDFAAGLKERGTGIGFAGLGAKVSFNVADRVITETISKSLSAGSNWYLKSKKELIWEEIRPNNLRNKGTRVEVHFRSSTSPSFKNREDLVRLLQRHYLPLLESKFIELYQKIGLYKEDLRFAVNGKTIELIKITDHFSLENIKEMYPKRRGKMFGYGIFGVAELAYPVAPDICGVLLCTHGKVIKPDMFHQFPPNLGPRLFGIVEVPEFVKFLTTSKTDFTIKGRHREFEKLYDPIRQAFKEWLRTLGLESIELVDTDEAMELERELRKLVENVPELSEFFGFRMRKEILGKYDNGLIDASTHEGVGITFPLGNGVREEGLGPVDIGVEDGQTLISDEKGPEKAKAISRKARSGPKIAFFDAPDRVDLAWVEGNNVVINSGHPSYKKNRSNAKTRRLHSLFAIASAIQKFLGRESEKPDLMFIDRMMTAWGKR